MEFVCYNRVRAYRQYFGLTQFELASLCGVSRNTISNVELCIFQPTAKLALSLCIVFGVPFDELFHFEKVET